MMADTQNGEWIAIKRERAITSVCILLDHHRQLEVHPIKTPHTKKPLGAGKIKVQGHVCDWRIGLALLCSVHTNFHGFPNCEMLNLFLGSSNK